MATYTDLGNRVRENVVVDYHTRETAQCVKLLNDNNEYRGVFKGTSEISAVNVHGGELSGVVLRDVEFAGSVNLPGHVDLTDLGSNLSEFKKETDERLNELNQLTTEINSVRNYAQTQTQNESISRQNADSELNIKISLVSADLSTKHDYLTSQIKSVSDSSVLKQDIASLTAQLTGKIESASQEASNAAADIKLSVANLKCSVSNIDAACSGVREAQATADDLIASIDSNVKNLTTQASSLEKAHTKLQSCLTSEAETRETADSRLRDSIGTVKDNIDTINDKISLSVNSLLNKIEAVKSGAADKDAFKEPLDEAKKEVMDKLQLSVEQFKEIIADLETVDAKAALSIENIGSLTGQLTANITELTAADASIAAAAESKASELAAAAKAAAEATAATNLDMAKKELSEAMAAADKQNADDIAALAARTTELETDSSQLFVDLAGEKSDRFERDAQLEADLKKHATEASQLLADNVAALEKSIAGVETEASEAIADLAAKTAEDIWEGCHYKIVRDGTGAWPYKCEDFAVNVYDDAGPAAVVSYVDGDAGNRAYRVGTAVELADKRVKFEAFAEIEPETVAASIGPGETCWFTESNSWKTTTGLGCVLTYKAGENGAAGEIAADPIAPTYCALKCNGVQVGKIYKATFDSAGKLATGTLTIATTDPAFASFLGFIDCQFEANAPIAIGTEQIEYVGDNKFELRSGIEQRKKIELVDEASGKRFGCVLSSETSNPIAVDEAGEIQSIAVRLDGVDGETKLSRESGFRAELSAWKSLDGVGHAEALEIDFADPEAPVFQLVDDAVLRAMPIESIDAAGTLSGCLVPEAWNVGNPLALDYGRVEQISAFVSAFVPVEAVQQSCYVLEKRETGHGCDCGCGSSVETVFAAEVAADGNIVEMKFTGRAFHIVVTAADGRVLRYSYAFKSRDEWPIFNEDTYRTTIAKTAPAALEFGDAYEDPKASWTAEASSEQLADKRQKFSLSVQSVGRKIKLQLPNAVASHKRAREFIIAVKPSGSDPMEVVFTDESGHEFGKDIVFARKFGAAESETFTVPAGKWTVYRVQEMRDNAFVVVDSSDAANRLLEKFEKLDCEVNSLNQNYKAQAIVIANEIDRAQNAETKLAETVSGLSGDVDELSSSLTAEIARATAAEEKLADDVAYLFSELSSEIGRAKTVEDGLTSDVKTLRDNLVYEIERSKAADEAIEAKTNILSTELSAAISGEADLARANETDIASKLGELSDSCGKISADHERRLADSEYHASRTFVEAELTAGVDTKTDLLKLVDIADTSKQYALVVDSGTLVLSAIEAAN